MVVIAAAQVIFHLQQYLFVIYLWWAPKNANNAKKNQKSNQKFKTRNSKYSAQKFIDHMTWAKTNKVVEINGWWILTRPKSSVDISQLIFRKLLISLMWWSCKSDEPNTNFGPFDVRTTSPSEPSLVMRTNRPPSNGNIFHVSNYCAIWKCSYLYYIWIRYLCYLLCFFLICAMDFLLRSSVYPFIRRKINFTHSTKKKKTILKMNSKYARNFHSFQCVFVYTTICKWISVDNAHQIR